MKNTLFTLFLSLVSCFAFGQSIPTTNLYMFQLATKDGNLVFTKPTFLSAFNPGGYSNQPYFFSENSIYSTVQTKNGNQTEIYSLNPDKQEITRITETKESEYSPTIMLDNQHFSVVRVDADDSSIQRLWKYPLNRKNSGSVILLELTTVGYHFWINENELLLFLVGDPTTLVIADVTTGEQKYVAQNPGRCFKRLKNGNVAVVHKSSEDTWFLKELDIQTGTLRTIVQTLNGSEDFEILSDGSFIMARGSKIYRYKEGSSTNWQLLTDVNAYGVQSVSRMALSQGGKFVIVGK